MKALALFGLFVVGIASAVVGRADESLFQVRPGEEPLLLLAPAPKGGTDLRRFLDQEPVIDRIYITDPVEFEETSTLVRGGEYLFWVWFVEGVCRPFEVKEGFFRSNGKMVYHVAYQFGGDTCNTIGVGIPLTVPSNAPLETYTWGARVTNGYGADTYYPATFTIVP